VRHRTTIKERLMAQQQSRQNPDQQKQRQGKRTPEQQQEENRNMGREQGGQASRDMSEEQREQQRQQDALRRSGGGSDKPQPGERDESGDDTSLD